MLLFGKLRCIFLDRDDADDEGRRRAELNSIMDERCVVQVSEQVSGRVAMYATRTNFSGRVLVGGHRGRTGWLIFRRTEQSAGQKRYAVRKQENR